MADTNELKVLEGIDTVAFVRKLSKASTEPGKLVPWQTSLSFDPSRDSDNTATKDGNVATASSLSTDFELEFLNNTSAIADAMYDSLFDGEVLEVWIVHRKRKNAEGKFFAWYLRATVSEDSNDNDPDDHSTRDVTFAVNGTPKRGWTELSVEQKAELDYIFRGLGTVAAGEDGTETNGGTPWDSTKDAGTNTADK